MNERQVFNFDAHEIRRVMIGEIPWAVAKDVADALGDKWKGTATIDHVPAEWRGVYSVQTPSGNQDMAVLSKKGLLFFLGRSDKPKALPMQKWAWGTVIPTVLETGSYSVAPALSPMDQLTVTMNNIVTALSGAVLETKLLVEATAADVQAVKDRVVAVEATVDPDRMAEATREEVRLQMEALEARKRTVAAILAQADQLMESLVAYWVHPLKAAQDAALEGSLKSIATKRLKDATSGAYRTINRIRKLAAGVPKNAIKPIPQAQASLNAVRDQMRNYGLTPPAAAEIVDLLTQQRLRGV